MGTSTIKAVGAVTAPSGDAGRPQRAVLRRWLLAAGGAGGRAEPAQLVDELEREVALLREENARLRVASERAGERPVNERVRAALPPLGADRDGDGDGDEPWELLTECMLLRDGLIDACGELERGARELRRRLESILPGAEGAPPATLVRDELDNVA